ncbi:hypothetical protein [Kitasatospora phosalacinea]|uniref:hypothetical protein n=1 Tax=Kitasatospora phosalacinea TaxID=2065 RepID=UPI002556E54B|nr:hypothetical protein [Kitasatospora phosalacinea]
MAEVLLGQGWRVRKQSWTEFEAEHGYARLSVLPLDPVVFTGEIAVTGITELIETFGRSGHCCTVELYDPDSGELLAEGQYQAGGDTAEQGGPGEEHRRTGGRVHPVLGQAQAQDRVGAPSARRDVPDGECGECPDGAEAAGDGLHGAGHDRGGRVRRGGARRGGGDGPGRGARPQVAGVQAPTESGRGRKRGPRGGTDRSGRGGGGVARPAPKGPG